ncbi:MAG: hypothetical protein C4538_07480 [Nitrospiraceae bacterium]|nr:MAG: hypothetical protein C4538_07480 [Nitrospiraceae bacterium]
MTEELNRTFNDEVNRYRNALLFYAKKCDWDTFKVNAGRLFDYIEKIEMSEIERRFFKISKIIVSILAVITLFIFKIDPDIYPALARLKEIIVILAVSGCCFEVFFFLNFRMYMKQKISFYKKRRERFITDIERDFKEIVV